MNSAFENNERVPVVFPDVDSLDSFADQVAEELSRGKSHAQIISEHVERQLGEQKWEAIAAVLLQIIDDDKPRLAARLLMYASGMLTEGNLTLPEIAKMHGITKQAAQQKGERLRAKLDLPLTSFMRSVEARETMRKNNFRKPKNAS